MTSDALHVRVLGSFEVVGQDGALLADLGGSRKARSLLKLLLLHRGRIVPHDVIIDALWGASPPAKPHGNIAALVSRLRSVLGGELLSRGAGGYCLRRTGPVRVRVDVEDAEGLVVEAERDLRAGELSIALAAALQALSLLDRGRLLAEEPPRDWVLEMRAQVEGLARRGRRAAWTAALGLGDWPAARECARRTVDVDVFDEEAHRAYMTAAHLAGQTASALADYERLRRSLADELGVTPDAETAALHVALLRGETLSVPSMTSADTGSRAPSLDPVFVGRAAELDRVADVWRDVLRGQGRLLLVSGEAGMGKSRFAQQAAATASASGALVLACRCYEVESSLFLQPVLDALRSAATLLPPEVIRAAAGVHGSALVQLLPDLSPVLPWAPRLRGDLEWERRRLFDAVVALFRGLARHQPVVLLVDDLHHAGASTVELLHYLLRRLGRERVLVLATLRSEEGTAALITLAEVCDVVELGPLTDAAVAQLAERMGVPAVAAGVVERARGHPLFAVELLRSARTAGALAHDEVPVSLRSAVHARARRSGSHVEELLHAAAVLGTATRLDDLAALLHLDLAEVTRRAHRAGEARLLVELGPGWEFSHDLVRDVFYASTPGPLRAALHREAARVLAQRPEAAAAHHMAVRDWRLAAAAYAEAARQAATGMAYREAVALLEVALQATSYDGDVTEAARLRLERGRLRAQLGESDGAREDYANVLQIAIAADDEQLEATAIERLAWSAYHARDFDRASELADRAAAAGRGRPGALTLAGRLRHASGDLDGAVRALGEAIAAVDAGAEVDDPATAPMARVYLGGVLVDRDQYGDALRLLDRARRECRRAGALQPMLAALGHLGGARLALGDPAGALTELERMARLAHELGCRPCRPRALTELARVWIELGDPQHALTLAASAEEEAVGLPTALHNELRLDALLAAAAGTADAGDLAGARRRLDEAEDLLDAEVTHRWRYRLEHLAVLTKVDASAAPRLLATARERGSKRFVCLALGALGHHAQAATLARDIDARMLLTRVAAPAEALATVDLIGAQLPAPLRDRYVARARARVAAGMQARPRGAAVSPVPPRGR